MSETIVQVNTAFLADVIADSYRDGVKAENGRIVKLLESILETRAKASVVHSQTIGIHELLSLIGAKNG